jgi:hypothetical protein
LRFAVSILLDHAAPTSSPIGMANALASESGTIREPV